MTQLFLFFFANNKTLTLIHLYKYNIHCVLSFPIMVCTKRPTISPTETIIMHYLSFIAANIQLLCIINTDFPPSIAVCVIRKRKCLWTDVECYSNVVWNEWNVRWNDDYLFDSTKRWTPVWMILNFGNIFTYITDGDGEFFTRTLSNFYVFYTIRKVYLHNNQFKAETS